MVNKNLFHLYIFYFIRLYWSGKLFTLLNFWTKTHVRIYSHSCDINDFSINILEKRWFSSFARMTKAKNGKWHKWRKNAHTGLKFCQKLSRNICSFLNKLFFIIFNPTMTPQNPFLTIYFEKITVIGLITQLRMFYSWNSQKIEFFVIFQRLAVFSGKIG